MSRRAQILSHRKRERERLGMHAVGGGGGWRGQIGRKKERKKEKKKEKGRAVNNYLGKDRDRDKEKERVGHVQGTGIPNLWPNNFIKILMKSVVKVILIFKNSLKIS
jgi:hypothetical protein